MRQNGARDLCFLIFFNETKVLCSIKHSNSFMTKKILEKDRAIDLRRAGSSYSEILAQVKVAKSTLSLWLRSVGLSKRQKQRITQKRLDAIKRGWIKWKSMRIERVRIIKERAKKEVQCISNRELWLIGVALYWAEGSKEKESSVGNGTQFSNSDPMMIALYLKWIREIINVSNEDICVGIYIHENHRPNIKEVVDYWSGIANIPVEQFRYVYFKRHNPKTRRSNTGQAYHGVLRIAVRKSSVLSRRIMGWVDGICEHCRVV